jgi:hypothetical protein
MSKRKHPESYGVDWGAMMRACRTKSMTKKRRGETERVCVLVIVGQGGITHTHTHTHTIILFFSSHLFNLFPSLLLFPPTLPISSSLPTHLHDEGAVAVDAQTNCGPDVKREVLPQPFDLFDHSLLPLRRHLEK